MDRYNENIISTPRELFDNVCRWNKTDPPEFIIERRKYIRELLAMVER